MRQFDQNEARVFGVNAAVFLEIIRQEQAEGNNPGDGWVYIGYDQLLTMMPWISESTLRRAIRQLHAEGVVIISQDNDNVFDRTANYKIDDKNLGRILGDELEFDQPMQSERPDDYKDLKDLKEIEDFDPEEFLINFPASEDLPKDLKSLRNFLKECPMSTFDGWDAGRIAQLIKVIAGNPEYEITLDVSIPDGADKLVRDRLIIGGLLHQLFEMVQRPRSSSNGNGDKPEVRLSILPLPNDYDTYNYNAKRAHLQTVFEYATDIYIGTCPEKSRPTRWWNPIKNLLKACDNDLPAARRVMIKAIKHMRESELTIAAPQSIEKAMLSQVANRHLPFVE